MHIVLVRVRKVYECLRVQLTHSYSYGSLLRFSPAKKSDENRSSVVRYHFKFWRNRNGDEKLIPYGTYVHSVRNNQKVSIAVGTLVLVLVLVLACLIILDEKLHCINLVSMRKLLSHVFYNQCHRSLCESIDQLTTSFYSLENYAFFQLFFHSHNSKQHSTRKQTFQRHVYPHL